MESINREEFERAAKRIMEMNSKAQLVTKRPKEEKKQEKDPPPQKEIPEAKRKKSSLLDIINFKNLLTDSDRTLIAGIMFLLSGEESDERLIWALLYIML